MQDFIQWTLKAIRDEGPLTSWMEERRVEWTPLLASRLKFLLEGRAFITISDEERRWFETYLLKAVFAHLSRCCQRLDRAILG